MKVCFFIITFQEILQTAVFNMNFKLQNFLFGILEKRAFYF